MTARREIRPVRSLGDGWQTEPVRSVCSLYVAVHVAWVSASDPRNQHVSWLSLDSYLLGGDHDPGVEEMWVSAGWPADVVSIGRSPGFVVSPRLRDVLEDAAPQDLEFAPIAVDGRPHWLVRVVTLLRALDVKASRVRRDSAGQTVAVSSAVWRSSALTRQAVFRLPQGRDLMYVTDGVAAAYVGSRCTGLTVIGPQGRVRSGPAAKGGDGA